MIEWEKKYDPTDKKDAKDTASCSVSMKNKSMAYDDVPI